MDQKIFLFNVDTKGNLVVKRRSDFMAYLKAFKGVGEIVIRKHRKTRTDKQNAYYWAAIVPLVAEYLSKISRRPYSKEEAHEVLKLEFNPKLILGIKGETKVLPGSTTLLDSFQFTIYVERIVQWGSESGITFPTPDEYYGNE